MSRARAALQLLKTGFVVVAVGLFGSQPAGAQSLVYGVDSGTDSLYTLDLDTGTVTIIGPLDPDPGRYTTPVSMAVRPSDGAIFVTNNSPPADDGLSTVDPTTGLATFVGGPLTGSIAFDPADTLYIALDIAGAGGPLAVVDPNTGIATPISGAPHLPRVFGLDFNPGDGLLYAISGVSQDLVLLRIDPATGNLLMVIPLNMAFAPDNQAPTALLFDGNGVLHATVNIFNGNPNLFEIDPTTGNVSNLRVADVAAQGLGVIIEPAGACCRVDATCEVATQSECEAVGGTYQGDDTVCGAFEEVSEPGLEIPDNSTPGVDTTIEVNESFSIADVNVDLAVAHTWVGDLVVTLQSPAGTIVTLVDRPGVVGPGFGCSADDIDAILDDEGAGGPVEDQCSSTPPAIGSPPSYVPNEALSAFDGEDAAGTWTIVVTDLAGEDTGTLDRWSLHIEGASRVTCPFVTNLDAKPGSCPNPLNRKSNGRIPMALVGQTYLDAGEIERSTLRLQRADGGGGQVAPNEGPPGPRSKIADVATPFDGPLCACHEETTDGIADVLMHFNTQEVVEALDLWNDFERGDTVELLLTAETLDGTPVVAGDCQVIVPPGPGIVTVLSNSPASISVYPPDINAVNSGTTAFSCEYPPDPVDVTLRAEPFEDGFSFIGWKIDGSPLVADPEITVHLETDWERTAEAVYLDPALRDSCGLGPEVALLLAPLGWLHRRRRRA